MQKRVFYLTVRTITYTSFITDKYLECDFLQNSPSLDNFLAADWLMQSLQRNAAKRSHSFLTVQRLPIS